MRLTLPPVIIGSGLRYVHRFTDKTVFQWQQAFKIQALIMFGQIDEICTKQLHYARQGVGADGNGWQLFADEGEMKMYRREEEIDGMVVDPLKACHVVKGVSAKEMCHYFFMPEYRNDWESK